MELAHTWLWHYDVLAALGERLVEPGCYGFSDSDFQPPQHLALARGFTSSSVIASISLAAHTHDNS